MLEKIIAEMPRAKISWLREHTFGEGVEAQCQLLAEQGYRKVPSVEELHEKILDALSADSVEEALKELHRWLLEGE